MKIEHSLENDIAIVKINNPPANTLNAMVLEEIRTCFNELKKNESVRAVIVTGEGRSFAAGADIKELTSWGSKDVEDLLNKGQTVFSQIENFPAPVIAVINGFALGGGLELALACDFRIASEEAKLGLPEVKLGVIPSYGGTQRLFRTVPMGHAKKMIYTGEIITARKAMEISLVEIVINHDGLMNEALEIARKITSNAPLAVRGAKKSINLGRNLSIEQGMAIEFDTARTCFDTDDRKEGFDAFMNKRAPFFRGK